MAGRGQMTEGLRAFMEGFLGRETSWGELRLIPYLQYQIVNEQVLDPKRINAEEWKILQLLREAGHIEGGATGFSMTYEFWTFCTEVLWRSYAAHSEFADPV